MWSLLALLLGIAVCVGAGLLALLADIERPLKFLPVYALAIGLFLGGLALILWCQPVGATVDDYLAAWRAVE